MATLAIGRSSSTCLSCRRGTGLSGDRHETIMGYGPDNGSPGCGEMWHEVRLDYAFRPITYDQIEDFRSLLWISDFIKQLPIVGW